MTAQDLEPGALRAAFGSFLTGVTVITTRQPDGSPRGFTANSFTSVSLSPPLLLVCIGRRASSHAVFSATNHFAVNILSAEQRYVSNVFASKEADKFAQVPNRPGALGSPIIDDCSAWFECRIHERVEAGDHTILIGEVIDFAHTEKGPLGYWRGGYVNLGLEQSAVEAAGELGTRVGAILEAEDCIAFDVSPDGMLRLPSAPSLGPASDPASLLGRFAREQLSVRLSFLFSVYGEPSATNAAAATHATCIFYRGTLATPWPQVKTLQAVPIAEVPWERLDRNEARMLKRYVVERERNTFGVYAGDSDMEHSFVGR